MEESFTNKYLDLDSPDKIVNKTYIDSNSPSKVYKSHIRTISQKGERSFSRSKNSSLNVTNCRRIVSSNKHMIISNKNLLQDLNNPKTCETYQDDIIDNEFKIKLHDISVFENYSPALDLKSSDRTVQGNVKCSNFRINLNKTNDDFEEKRNKKYYSFSPKKIPLYPKSKKELSTNLTDELYTPSFNNSKYEENFPKKKSIVNIVSNLREQLTNYNKNKEHQKKPHHSNLNSSLSLKK